MGSKGSGHLSDYSGRKKGRHGEGGSSGVDACSKPISATLEDVERCAYYLNHKEPPEKDAPVTVTFDKRPGVSTKDGLLVGYLPTGFNYLRGCLEAGYKYSGSVTSSRNKPTVQVKVALTAAM